MPDVIVIGAGVVGAGITHWLAALGAQVAVLDAGEVAGGASAATFAVDITRVKTPRSLFDLSVASGREHAELQQANVENCWLHTAATLEWEGTPLDQQRLRDRMRRLSGWGYPADWLLPERLPDIEPALRLPTGTAAEVAFYPSGAWYEPAAFTRALVEGARKRGAVLHLADPVTAMSTANGRITEVRTARGHRFSADIVVNCAGPQAAEIAALADAVLPLRRVSGMVVTTSTIPVGLRTILAAPDLNIRPHLDGRVMLHSWLIDGALVASREGQWPALAMRLLTRARTLLPGLAHARVHSAGVGVRPVPLDGLPIVGNLAEVENLYMVVSHSAVHLAPILGRLAAFELTGHRQEGLDPFRPTRFRAGAPTASTLDENTSTMLARIGACGTARSHPSRRA